MRIVLLLAVLAAPGCRATPAPLDRLGDAAPGGADRSLGGSLIPSPAERHLRRERLLAADLADTIEKLWKVEAARVHLELADRSLWSRDRDAGSSAAVVLRVAKGAAPREERIRELAAAAIGELEPESVEVFVAEQPGVKAVETQRVGPLRVAADSATATRALLGALLAACLLLAGALIHAGLRLRKLRRRLRETPRELSDRT
ncbi:MAG: hypothetical protein R6V85_02635 [Polyangia bacterium]